MSFPWVGKFWNVGPSVGRTHFGPAFSEHILKLVWVIYQIIANIIFLLLKDNMGI